MKKIWIILTVLVLSILVVGCKKEEPEPEPTEKDVDITLSTDFASALVDQTVYLTTCGQADIDIVENILLFAGLTATDYTRDNLLTAAEAEAGSTVILVVGTSGKGLGAAGTDTTAENARAEAFASRSNQDEINLIVIHVGGAARRGELSDTIIASALAGSDLSLVVIGGDADDYFTDRASTSSPLYLFSTASKIVNPIKVLFGIA